MKIPELEKLLLAITPRVEAVGRYQLEHFRSRGPGGGDEKAAREFVSEIDVESENRLKEDLLRLLPSAGFFGEETARTRGEYTWVVDPLDGTSNYLGGIDVWAVSAALTRGNEILLGLVHKPWTGENFYAVRGGGAFHRGPGGGKAKRLERARKFPLRDALVGTGFPYRSPDTTESFFGAAREILFRCRDLRRIGAAALDLACLAAGYLQAFWEVDLQPYDVAAALLLLEESGCPFSTFSGAPYDPFRSRTFVAGPPGAVEELREIVLRHYGAGLRD